MNKVPSRDPASPQRRLPQSCLLQIREDLAKEYSDLLGAQEVNGRRLHVEEWIARMTKRFEGDFRAVLKARSEFLHETTAGRTVYSFLASDQMVTDADGNQLSVGQIRQGMLDQFEGRQSSVAWKLNSEVEVPSEVLRPGLQGTGPFDDLGMAMSAINARTSSWMADWEDAGNDYEDKLYRAWRNLKRLLAGDWDQRTYLHPLKHKEYRIQVERSSWPTLFHRVPGLHLRSRQLLLEGKRVPAIIPALVIHSFNNFDSQREHDSGIYYYIPKIETPHEALLVAKLLQELEEAIGVPRGTLKIEMLNERVRFAANQEAIMWVLRDWLVGINVGRWDYLNSRIEMGKDDEASVFPDPHRVGMTESSMTAYTRRNALLNLLVGGFPIGGMSAIMKNPGQPEEVNREAVRSISFDKLRERLTGLFLTDRQLYDTYRQSWVATTEKEYVEAGREPLVAEFQLSQKSQLQQLVDQTTVEERDLLKELGLVKGGRISPFKISEEHLTAEQLFSDQAWNELFAVPFGEVTEEGLRYAIYMASEYMFQQLNGNNAAAIEDYLSGNRLMNDFATYEIFWHWLWTALHHRVELTRDGESTKRGERVRPELMERLLQERAQQVKEYFAEQDRQGIQSRFDRSKAPLVLELLARQLSHNQWITYGSRVLLSIIEVSPEAREQVLEAVFSTSRKEVVSKVRSGELPEFALDTYDYVYDVFENGSGSLTGSSGDKVREVEDE